MDNKCGYLYADSKMKLLCSKPQQKQTRLGSKFQCIHEDNLKVKQHIKTLVEIEQLHIYVYFSCIFIFK